MSVYTFTGAAGTGKTKRLVEKLEGRLKDAALLPDQRVVALTRMHGSRFRSDRATGRVDRAADCRLHDP